MTETKEQIADSKTNAGVGFLAALAAADISIQTNLGKTPFIIIPGSGETASLEQFLDAPVRDKTTRRLLTLEHFNEYLKRFKQDDSSVYVTAGSSGGFIVTAELDHRSKDKPVWPGHKADFVIERSEPLARWLAKNKHRMGQEEFADLLEERSADIRVPAAAEILELAQSLHVTRNMSVKSLVRGSRAANSLTFNKEESLKAGDGSVELPTSFEIEVPAFARHFETVRLKALLRPRIADDRPSFTYELQLVDESVEQVLETILNAVRTQTGLPVYR